jgi:protein-disulfide isomerase
MPAGGQRSLVGAVLATAALVALGLIVASALGSRGDESRRVAAAAGGSADTESLLRGIPQKGIALGSPSAPVTLVEYADLQCPYCALWAQDAFPAIVEDYVRPGKVRIVFRGLAFVGPDSETALRTALAAGEQGRLWNVLHQVYRHQGHENSGWVTDELLLRVGRDVNGLDAERMLRRRDSAGVDRALAAAAAAAKRAGIRGTPSFELGPTGGRLEPFTVSSLDAAPFRKRLDALLAK